MSRPGLLDISRMRSALCGLLLAICLSACVGEAVAAPPHLQSPSIRAEHVVLAASEFGRGIPSATGPCMDSKHRQVPCPRTVPPAPGSKATIFGEALLAGDPLSPLKLLWVSFSTAKGAHCLQEVAFGGVNGNATPLSCSERLPCERGLCLLLSPAARYMPAFVAGLAPAGANMTLRVAFVNGETASVRLQGPLAHGIASERMFLVLIGKQPAKSVTFLENGRVVVSQVPFG